jgi:hypothetical protein
MGRGEEDGMTTSISAQTSAALRKFFLSLSSCCLLLGCGTLPGKSLRPVAPENAVKPAKEIAVGLRPQAKSTPADFDEMKAVVVTLRNDILAAAEQKNAQSWDTGLVTLIGGSMATVGSVTSRNGLTNSGILLALLGLGSEQFYKPSTAIEVHLDADSKLQCIQDAVFDLTEADRALAVGSDFAGADEAGKAVESLNGTINAMMLSYRRSLLGIHPGSATRADILGFMKRFAADEAARTDVTKGVPPPEKAQQAAAASKFIGLSTALQACVKLGVASQP